MTNREKERRGRPRRFKFGEIVLEGDLARVVVDHRTRMYKAEYRIIPLNGSSRRYGRAVWRASHLLQSAGKFSSTASLATYRANNWLDETLPEGRGCDCQCCVHEKQPHQAFSNITGKFLGEDDD